MLNKNQHHDDFDPEDGSLEIEPSGGDLSREFLSAPSADRERRIELLGQPGEHEYASPLRLLTTELSFRVAESARRLTGPEDSGRLLIELIGSKDREHFVVLHLSSRHRVQAVETVSIGSLNAAVVHPREVFKAAILANSQAVVCGHNHPSGDLEPSADDISLYRRLREAGEILGIEVLDFLVVSISDHRSLTET